MIRQSSFFIGLAIGVCHIICSSGSLTWGTYLSAHASQLVLSDGRLYLTPFSDFVFFLVSSVTA